MMRRSPSAQLQVNTPKKSLQRPRSPVYNSCNQNSNPNLQQFPNAFSGRYVDKYGPTKFYPPLTTQTSIPKQRPDQNGVTGKLSDVWRTMEGPNVQTYAQTSSTNHGVTGNLVSGSMWLPQNKGSLLALGPEISGSIRAPLPGLSGSIRAPLPENQTAKLQVSSHSAQGMKPEDPNRANQDAYLEISISEGKKLLGVFDGHGVEGEHVSNMVKSVFADLAYSIVSASDIKGAFQQAFGQARIRVMQANIGEESGTTATVALVDSVQKSVSIAYAGDSTAIVIDSRGNIVFQSEDHRPGNEKETQRLRACGSQVIDGRLPLNSNPEITFGFSRAIGDFRCAQQGIVAEPDVIPAIPFEAGSSLILASDGVWDVLPKSAVGNMVAQSPDSAHNIVGISRSIWQQTQLHIDDITAVVAKYA
jgi:serine/threonine protein phosphatase PrpC